MLSDFQTGMMTETQVIDAYYRIRMCRAFNTNTTIWLLQQPPLRRNFNNILQFYNEIIQDRITEDEDALNHQEGAILKVSTRSTSLFM